MNNQTASAVKPARNGEIDFWKFIFILGIVLHHSYLVLGGVKKYFILGSTFVEFFFIVSGYLMALSASRKPDADMNTLGSETSSFIYRKVKAFAPYYIFGSAATLLGNLLYMGPRKLIMTQANLQVPFSGLLQTSGIPYRNITGSIWYLSAMVLTMFLLYPILRRYFNVFVNIAAPLIAIFLYGYMLKHDGYIGAPKLWYGFASKGLLRGIAGISLGCSVFNLSQKLSRAKLTPLVKRILSAADIFCLAGSIALVIYNFKKNSAMILVLMFYIALIIIASGQASINKIFQNKICYFLGKYSMAIFMTHYSCSRFMAYAAEHSEKLSALIKTPRGSAAYAALFVAVSLIFALICIAVTDPIQKRLQAAIRKAA